MQPSSSVWRYPKRGHVIRFPSLARRTSAPATSTFRLRLRTLVRPNCWHHGRLPTALRERPPARFSRSPRAGWLAFGIMLALEHRFMWSLQRHPVERRNPLAGGRLELVGELPGVVPDQFGVAPCPAVRHVECPLCGELRMVRRHGGDDPLHLPALERVDGRRPGPAEMARLRVAVGEPGRGSVVQAEANAVAFDPFHRCGQGAECVSDIESSCRYEAPGRRAVTGV